MINLLFKIDGWIDGQSLNIQFIFQETYFTMQVFNINLQSISSHPSKELSLLMLITASKNSATTPQQRRCDASATPQKRSRSVFFLVFEALQKRCKNVIEALQKHCRSVVLFGLLKRCRSVVEALQKRCKSVFFFRATLLQLLCDVAQRCTVLQQHFQALYRRCSRVYRRCSETTPPLPLTNKPNIIKKQKQKSSK